MPRSSSHRAQSKQHRRSNEYRILRQNLEKYKIEKSKMISKNNIDENKINFFNSKILRIERQLYQQSD